jgi:hypothetical protein
VQTYSYDKKEFVDMWCISSLGSALEYLGLRHTLMPYLQTHHGLKFSDTIDFVYREFMRNPHAFNDDFLTQQFKCIYEIQMDCTLGLRPDNLVDFDPAFPFWLSTPNYIGLVILTRLQNFIEPICQKLAALFRDERLIDLAHYINNSIIDVTYDPVNGRRFNCDYDWLGYFNERHDLVRHPVTYVISDTAVYLNTRKQDINWHLSTNPMQRLIQYTFQQITEINAKTSKTINPL